MKEIIINKIVDAIEGIEVGDVVLTIPKSLDQGNFSTNVAMRCAKRLKKSPIEIANTIANTLIADGIQKVEVAGPGFINIFLDNESLLDGLENVTNIKKIGNGETVLIDYSSPNIAKKMHIAHLRSTAIGDSLKRIYQKIGYNAIGINHIGDWGTQFGKLIVAYRLWLDEENYQKNPVDELMRIYVKFSNEATEELVQKAREELVKVQKKDPENYALYEEFIKVSMTEYDKIYNKLGVNIEEVIGESFYNDMMPKTVDLLMEKGLAKIDKGAKMVYFDESTNLPPAMLQKSDGAFGYTASDISAVLYRTERWTPKKILYVVDNRQSNHFRQIFAIKDMLGLDVETVHVDFGVMSTDEGAFSTRLGNIIRLDDLLSEGYKRALDAVNVKNPSLSDGEKENIATKVSVGAIKYFDLSQNRSSDIVFSWDKALAFEGNTSSYLQYTYTRIQSLKKKANISITNKFKIIDEIESEIVTELKKYQEVVLQAAEKYRPNIIANYLFVVAQKFNSLYNKINFLNDPDNIESRINLANVVSLVLQEGLNLLGIETLERM